MATKIPSQVPVDLTRLRSWTLLTNHAQVLLALARNPNTSTGEIATSVQISERSAFRILADLQQAGYVRRAKVGRRNRYEVCWDAPIGEPIASGEPLHRLLRRLSGNGTESAAAAENRG
jgi:hypothetical protein